MRPAVSGLLALLLVAGCSSSEGAPQTLPPAPPVTETPSAPPTARAIPLPAEAEAEDSFGAAAFVRHYFAVLNEAYATGDPTQLSALSEEGCLTCQGFIEAAETYAAQGQRVVGDFVEVIEVAAPPVEEGVSVVQVLLQQPEREVVDIEGQLVRTQPSEPPSGLVVTVFRTSNSWILREVQTP